MEARETDPAEEQAVELAGHLGVVPAEVDCARPRRPQAPPAAEKRARARGRGRGPHGAAGRR